jgi:hypothetical protein
LRRLKPAGIVHASGDTTGTLRVAGKQVVGPQIRQTGNATQRHVAVAIRRVITDHIPQIGVAALHRNEAALLVTPQVANVVGDGWNHFGALCAGHVTRHFFVSLFVNSYTMSKYFIFYTKGGYPGGKKHFAKQLKHMRGLCYTYNSNPNPLRNANATTTPGAHV